MPQDVNILSHNVHPRTMLLGQRRDRNSDPPPTCTSVLSDGSTRCGLPPVKKRGSRVVLCRQHHAEYVEKTKAYKQDSREADRLSIADKEKQRSIIAELDKQIEGKEKLIDTLESEIRRRREHHHEYFGQADEGHAQWLERRERERLDELASLAELRETRERLYVTLLQRGQASTSVISLNMSYSNDSSKAEDLRTTVPSLPLRPGAGAQDGAVAQDAGKGEEQALFTETQITETIDTHQTNRSARVVAAMGNATTSMFAYVLSSYRRYRGQL
ncbi:hypothetical protein C8Q76DRAFT_425142 [Earliella scabrosa]|nr:hypothetical protein C8Q76DRAFT_425142 [Earliella scabrosa]